MAFYLEEYMTHIYGILTILGVIVLIYIINSEGNPAFKMTWMLCVLAFPVIGTLFYIYVKMQFGTRFMKDRLGKLKLETAPYMQQDQDVVDAIWPAVGHCPACLHHLSSNAWGSYPLQYAGKVFRLGSITPIDGRRVLRRPEGLSSWNILL